MALLHEATLVPSKLDLVVPWAASQPWFEGDPASVVKVAAYRLDDPAGEVGLETLLLRAGDGPVLQVPVTYRDAPLAGAEASLVGTMRHSVLGERFVYDAVADPVYLATLVATALTGGGHADIVVRAADGSEVTHESSTTVVGSGEPGTAVPPVEVGEATTVDGSTVVRAGGVTVVVARRPEGVTPRDLVSAAGDAHDESAAVLTGMWSDDSAPATLAVVLVH
ncbi:hypothetical protein EDF38_3027 [Frigoribacterium sp. PhB160]|jgi:hypothetical protein|uniref:CG0192-related protein n=1 Tax=Frigoribacterium sp. PhB160 TaxID=2485192 RepID=UPI000F48CDDA|nr:hypothetical protein [Frigoribacterium sp. PhB160]ROS58284.1 hypothetical protein EDF38_3027 [Frigoribacterium sp. PhB160]